MDEICRLCCSTNFVNNHIFDEENALYLKMSLYLPIKVFKNDRLPQKICDKCSCRVNDFYQFCNETIEVQNRRSGRSTSSGSTIGWSSVRRGEKASDYPGIVEEDCFLHSRNNRLRAALISTAVDIEESIDLTLIKNDLSPLPLPPGMGPLEPNVVHKLEPNPELDGELSHSSYMPPEVPVEAPPAPDSEKPLALQRPPTCDQATQTQGTETSEEGAAKEINIEIPLYKTVKIKEEPKSHSPTVKMEDFFVPDNGFGLPHSDDSENDNISLINFQKKKKSKKAVNGKVQKKKRKSKASEWEVLMRALPEGTMVMDPAATADVKPDLWPDLGFDSKRVKSEPVEYHCCICFVQCYSRSEMLQHYKEHASQATPQRRPAPPPPPDAEPIKCPRCQKRLERATWAAHWARHWERDHLPYRCALCEKAFRDRHQILKHGLTHKLGEGTEGEEESLSKRYVCDLCPEGFVYMRFLLAHRTTAHPEAAGRALALRCAVCARQFAHLNSLRRHLTAHSGARDFLCNVCGKALSSREHLKFHIRIHTGYKPNVCKTCGKGFVKKCNLTLHERVHSGEKPHVCSHCGKAFSQRSTLVIHERYHSGARPYICSLCGRGFVAKGLLSMHLKTTCI